MTRTAYQNIDALIYLRENNALAIVSVMAVQFAVTVSKWTLQPPHPKGPGPLDGDAVARCGTNTPCRLVVRLHGCSGKSDSSVTLPTSPRVYARFARPLPSRRTCSGELFVFWCYFGGIA